MFKLSFTDIKSTCCFICLHICLIFVILAVCTSNSAGRTVYTSEFISLGNSQYSFSYGHDIHWATAWNYCKQLNANLMVVESETEWKLLYPYLNSGK